MSSLKTKRNIIPPRPVLPSAARFTAHSQTWSDEDLFAEVAFTTPIMPPPNTEPTQCTLTQLWNKKNPSAAGSINKLAEDIQTGTEDNILLGDINWRNIKLSPTFKHHHFSGKVTSTIFDKVNGVLNYKNIVLTFSPNNLSADVNKTIYSKLFNIIKALKNKFQSAQNIHRTDSH